MFVILVAGLWVLVLCLDTFAHLLLITVANFGYRFLYPVKFASLCAISILLVIFRHIFVPPFPPHPPQSRFRLLWHFG